VLCFDPQIKSRARENNVYVEIMRKVIITEKFEVFSTRKVL